MSPNIHIRSIGPSKYTGPLTRIQKTPIPETALIQLNTIFLI